MVWADGDIEVSYFLGLLRGMAASPQDETPTMDRILLDIESFKSLGYETPIDMLLALKQAHK